MNSTDIRCLEQFWRMIYGTEPVCPIDLVRMLEREEYKINYPARITERGKGRWLVNEVRHYPGLLTIEETDQRSRQGTRMIRLGTRKPQGWEADYEPSQAVRI